MGAARLAAGLTPFTAADAVVVERGAGGAYLPAKYERWTAWTRDLL